MVACVRTSTTEAAREELFVGELRQNVVVIVLVAAAAAVDVVAVGSVATDATNN